MADETKPPAFVAPVAPAAPSAPVAPKPPAPPVAAKPAAPAVDLAGKTTTAAATAAKVSSRDPDDSSPLVTRRVWLGMAWGAFSAASAAALAATGRFMFPNVLNEPPQQFKVGFPADFGMGVDERFKESNGVLDRPYRRRHRPSRKRLLRAEHDVHASGLHAELPGG
jgi:cytochrome b6-f complex iron-sulfur subunit